MMGRNEVYARPWHNRLPFIESPMSEDVGHPWRAPCRSYAALAACKYRPDGTCLASRTPWPRRDREGADGTRGHDRTAPSRSRFGKTYDRSLTVAAR